MKKSLLSILVLMLVAVITAGCAGIPAVPAPESSTPTGNQSTTTPTPPVPPTPTQVPASNDEKGDFRLLISDEVNAIEDFEHLWVTIESIGVHPAGEQDGWLEIPDFEPVEVDLTELREDNATEIWSGDLEDGEYVKVFIYISGIDYELKDDITADEVKLPSGKLQISQPFEVSDGEVTNFVYDITVIKSGNSGKYILKPQIGASGPNQNFVEIAGNGKVKKYKEQNQEKHQGQPEEPNEEQNEEQHGNSGEPELDLEIVAGEIAPGEPITLLVTLEDEPVAGATAKVNGEILTDLTDEDGMITFSIPEDADKLEIEVEKGDLEGELEIEIEV